MQLLKYARISVDKELQTFQAFFVFLASFKKYVSQWSMH